METQAPPTNDARVSVLMLGGILATALALRVRGGWNDPWLDEIWSLDLAREVRTPLDVFTAFHHEINHYLNTLWLWLAGGQLDLFLYRVPSLLAGIGAVVVAARIAWRRGPAAVYFTTVVVSFSYVLVLYASEIRGYASLVFFSFLSFLSIEAYLRTDRARMGVAFSLCATLGLLSHLLFLSVLLAALTWSVWRVIERRMSPRAAAARLALCYALPVLCLGALYLVDVRHIVVGGGGASGSLVADYGTALSWALGAPVSAAAQLLGCVLAVAVLDAGFRLVLREDRGQAIFFLCAIVVFPVLLVVGRDSPVVYTRHFILPIAFLLLLLGFALAALWERGGARSGAALVLLAVYLVANGAHLRELLLHGRGQNAEAIRFVLEQSKPGLVTIGADDDYRIQRVVAFYRSRLGDGTRIGYQPRGTWRDAGPEWLIVNRDSFELPIPRGDEIRDDVGRRFGFVQSFPAAPLAGLHWFVYRNRSE